MKTIKIFGWRLMTRQELHKITSSAWWEGMQEGAMEKPTNTPICTTNCRTAKCVKAKWPPKILQEGL